MVFLYKILTFIILSILFALSNDLFASINIPGVDPIIDVSIDSTAGSGRVEDQINTLAYKVFSVLKIVIAGFALIYMVIMGAKMIAYSDNEEQIKSQRRQIIYLLIGFLFLNLPGFIYQFFAPENKSAIAIDSGMKWSNVSDIGFWDSFTAAPIFLNLVSFLRVFVFGIAVLMLTWAAFSLIISGGDDEKRKMAKNRFVYGILGLIFLGFIEVWSRVIAIGDFFGTGMESVSNVSRRLLGLALFFAGPVAIIFLIIGAYYYITSAGDEERTKKGKAIILHTFVATLILLAAYTFLNDLVTLIV